MQHGSLPSPVSGGGAARPRTPRGGQHRHQDLDPAEVTDIIPFNAFDDLDGAESSGTIAFGSESETLGGPELDDMHDTDSLIALRLLLPRGDAASPALYDDGHAPTERLTAPARHGKHRSQPTSAVKGRVMIAAMAAGAAAAAAHAATHPSGTAAAETVTAAGTSAQNSRTSSTAGGMQMVTVKAAANAVEHNEELAKGVAYAQERAEREARLQRPLFAMPTRGTLTSTFGYRWGVLHAGLDIANSIGTPILAASDGVVIEAGPSAGYGMLVKLRHSDGTVTLYGHVNTTTVSVGERVMAGDQIATMGNRGYSTGPHLHFEVLLGGTHRVDPAPWLAKRGVNIA